MNSVETMCNGLNRDGNGANKDVPKDEKFLLQAFSAEEDEPKSFNVIICVFLSVITFFTWEAALEAPVSNGGSAY